MTTEEIIAGNKLMAEFMGMEKVQVHIENYDYEEYLFRGCDKDFKRFIELQPKRDDNWWCIQLKFDSSWDWLMPVVFKCTKVIVEQPVTPKWTKEEAYAKKLYTMHLNNPIESVWLAVVEFIKWYNANRDSKQS